MRMLTQSEQRFLTEFFRNLRASGIPNALARNAGDFPRAIGNDIDLLIGRDSRHGAERLFHAALKRAGGRLWQRNPREYVLDLRFTLPDSAEPLHLDLFWGVFTWHGLEYLDSSSALTDARPSGISHYLVRPADEALGMYAASLLWGGFYKEKYGRQMREILEEPAEARVFADRCRHAFGDAPLPIVPGADPPPSRAEALAGSRQLRRRLRETAFRRSWLKSLCAIARYWAMECATLFRPSGICLLVPVENAGRGDELTERLTRSFLPVFEGVHRVNLHRAPDIWRIRKHLAQSAMVIVIADSQESERRLKKALTFIAWRAFLPVAREPRHSSDGTVEAAVREWLFQRSGGIQECSAARE